MKKKVIIPIIIVVLLIIAAVVFVFLYRGRNKATGNGKLTYVESVGIISTKSVGVESRYMGVVESQETKSINKDANKTVKEVYVKEGDVVKEGDELFSYDTTDMELDLEQMNLDRTGIVNTIASYNTSLTDYKTQRDNATNEDDILSYTSQINSINTSIKEQEYNLTVKDLEITKQQNAIDEATVTAPMSGIIKKINESAGESTSFDMNEGSTEDSNAYITIIAEGEYRIKGTADESSIRLFQSGTPVLIRSRVDESIYWKGTVSKVDLEPESNNTDGGYGMMGGSGTMASSYSFYVKPENTDDMILGQHLYIELDMGQTDVKSGIFLPSYYLIQENDEYFVWKQGEDNKIVKTKVTVGDYDENLDVFQIVDGLKAEDYIAFPNDDVAEGNECTTSYEDVQKQNEEGPDSSEGSEEGMESTNPDNEGTDSTGPGGESIDDTEGSDGDIIISPDGPGGSSDGGDSGDGPSSDLSPADDNPDGSGTVISDEGPQ